MALLWGLQSAGPRKKSTLSCRSFYEAACYAMNQVKQRHFMVGHSYSLMELQENFAIDLWEQNLELVIISAGAGSIVYLFEKALFMRSPDRENLHM